MAPRRIALVGTMGSGKTTVGRALAARLGWTYLDNDELLVRRAGRTSAALLAEAGEQALRAAEAAALREALAAEPPVVVGVAGGTAAEPAARELLRGAFVVWLRADPATLAARLGADPDGRPWLGDDPAGAVRRLDAARRGAYAALADHVVDVDGRDPDDVVTRILAALPEEWGPWPT